MLNTSNQKTFIILIAVFSFLSLSGIEISRAEVLEDFLGSTGNKFSDDNWRSRNGDPGKSYKIVEEEGNSFLRALAKNESVQLFRKKGWALKENPVFSWSWRVQQFPQEANGHRVLSDSAVGVYVVFPSRWFVPESIKYIWSEKVPVGTVVQHHDHFPAIVIRTGSSEKGKWIVEERNVIKDYQLLFHRDPTSSPVAFGVLTDSNDTKSESAGDYDNFKILPAFSPPVITPVPMPVLAPVKKNPPKMIKKQEEPGS